MNKISTIVAQHIDPYHAIFYKKLYDKYWKNEVDGIYIMLSGNNYLSAAQFIKDLWKDEAKYIDYRPDLNDHGQTLNVLYPKVKDSEVIMIMDSDEWIFRNGVISNLANYILKDDYDIVSSFCNSGSQRLVGKIVDNLTKTRGARLNPMIAFIRKSVLDKVEDLHFGAKIFNPGDRIKQINWTVPQYFPLNYGENKVECMDTAGWLGVQLMALTNKIKDIEMNGNGLMHSASLSSWTITYKDQIFEHKGQNFEDRLLWWYFLSTRYQSYFPSGKHLKDLLRFAEVNHFTEDYLKLKVKELLEKYPEFNL